MVEEDKDRLDDESEEEEDEGEEIKLISISESIKIRKKKRQEEREVFEKKLGELQEKTERLKKEYNQKYKK